MYDISTIDRCVKFSRRKLETLREERVSAIKKLVGIHYSENGHDKVMPVNLLELALTIYIRNLAASAPKCVVSTENTDLKPFANDLGIVMNQVIKEIKLVKSVRSSILEAMFAIGIVKVGIAGTDPRPNIGDEPFVSVVQLDDYFVDMSAKSWNEIQYEGNDYWMSKDDVKSLYGVDLCGDEYNGTGDDGVEQARSVSNDEPGGELSERVHLRDVYIYGKNRMVTYAIETMKVLRDIPWDGPEGSPYVKLSFEDVPGNLMPLSPISVWQDLNDFCNQLFRKLGEQAVSSKKVAVFSGGSDDDVDNFRDAEDGGAIRGSGNDPREIAVGGIDQANLAFFLQTRDLYSLLAGNLDSLGGLSPQAETATQDRIISEAASARLKDMGDRVIEFVEDIVRRIAWYTWTDPIRERKYRKVVSERFNIGVNKEWTPETRDGDFLDYNFNIAVFSMKDDSPDVRVQKLANAFNTFIAPLLPQLEQMGFVLNPMKVMEYVGRNANIPELVEFFDVRPELPNALAESSSLPQPDYVSSKPPVTRRVYERVNRPGSMTQSGKTAVLSAALLGKRSQAADMAGLGIGRTR